MPVWAQAGGWGLLAGAALAFDLMEEALQEGGITATASGFLAAFALTQLG